MSGLREIGGFLRNVLTTTGDLLYRGASGPTRLPIGSEGEVLTVTSGVPSWEAGGGGGGITTEQALDAVGAAIIGGTGITATFDDGADTITIDSDITQYTDPDAVAAVAAADDYLLNTGDTGTGNYIFESDNATGFIVRADTGDTKILVVDTVDDDVEIRNGADLLFYSDDGTTEKASIDGATGNIQTDGTLSVDGAADFNSTLNVDGNATFEGTITQDVDSATALVIRKEDNTDVFTVDTVSANVQVDGLFGVNLTDTDAFGIYTSGGGSKVIADTQNDDFELRNSMDLRLFSDGGATEKASIAAATGNAQFDGTVQADTSPLTIAGAKLNVGTGSPEGVVTGNVGDLFQRTNGGTGTTFYIKESGAGNTGWVAVTAGGAGISQETAYDTIHASIIGGVNLTATVDDVLDTITLDVDDAFLGNAGDTGDGAYFFKGDENPVLAAQKADGTNVLYVDALTGAGEVELRNGADLRGFSDDGTAEKWSIDGATGNLQTDGTVRSESDFLIGANSIMVSGINFVIDGGGSTITTGVKGYLPIPFKCTITAARLLADQSGSIVVDIWKDTYANYPPVDADSITSATPPTISSATKSEDTTLSSWTTTLNAGDILGFNVDSVTTVQRVTVALTVKRAA